MKRIVLLLWLAISAPATAAASSWPGQPSSPAPRLSEQGPPPAWAESRERAVWMRFGSYCWSGASAGASQAAVCADMIPPQSRNDLAVLRVRRGALVRVHLAFVPRSVHLTVFRGMSFTHKLLAPKRIVVWRATRGGVISLDVRAAAGSASYLMRVRMR